MSAASPSAVPEADPDVLPARGESRAWKKLKRNKSALFGFALVLFFVAVAILAPVLPIADPAATSWSAVRKAPSLAHWLGTDEIGRDILSRMIWGAQASLLAGVVSVVIAVVTAAIIVLGDRLRRALEPAAAAAAGASLGARAERGELMAQLLELLLQRLYWRGSGW